MKDEEIIKALEICADDKKPCDGCVFHEDNFCGTDLEKAALDLIQRQQKRFDKILSYIDRVEHSGLGKKKALEYIRKFIVKGCDFDDR